MKQFKKRIDLGKKNGASFVGLNGIVIKSHGGANVAAYANAIEEAVLEVEKNVPELITHDVQQMIEG